MPPKKAALAASPPADVEALFSNLHKRIKDDDYRGAVKAADQVLAVLNGDLDALRCKVVALIRADDYDNALEAIGYGEKLKVDFSFEKAYCLYKQNKLHEAVALLNGREESSEVLQLKAQIYYRLGKSDSCLEIYERLQKLNADLSLDMKTNILAALIASGKSTEVQAAIKRLKINISDDLELAYNNACSLIDVKKYAEAKEQLNIAIRAGKEDMTDEIPEEDIDAELAPINVQLAYVTQLQGDIQRAAELYAGIISKNVADPSSLAVATNNLIAIKGTKEVSDSLRKLDKFIVKASNSKHFQYAYNLETKLFLRQKEALYSNRLLLLLHANKIDQAQELAGALLEMFPNSIFPVLLQAAVFVREKKIPKAEEILSQYAGKNTTESVRALLALAQVAASANHFQVCAEALSKVPDIQHMPATVATLVSLRERVGDIISASAVLDSAVEWWKNSMTEDSKLDVIIREAATFKLNHGRDQEASQLYEELVKSHGSVEALSGLVTTLARTDIDKAEQYEKQLRPLAGLKGINVESLERTAGARNVEGAHAAKAEVDNEAKKQKTKKRKRKPKFPKGFDPANPGPPPDPERWLPKRERSTYRPKRKDKRAQVRGSQGAVVREKHDSAAPATSSATNSTSKPAQVAPSTSKDQPKASHKGKKKSRN